MILNDQKGREEKDSKYLASPQLYLSSKCHDLEAFLPWPDVRSGNAVVKLMVLPLLNAFLGSRSSRHGSAAAAGCRGGVAVKGWGPACSCS